ncbi:hypothetical protein WS62_29815 [Burkholderia sp. ABCPW 14]|nr:hypothetical protein WS62_29815 [Burkholderia sp. ABCPW 14]
MSQFVNGHTRIASLPEHINGVVDHAARCIRRVLIHEIPRIAQIMFADLRFHELPERRVDAVLPEMSGNSFRPDGLRQRRNFLAECLVLGIFRMAERLPFPAPCLRFFDEFPECFFHRAQRLLLVRLVRDRVLDAMHDSRKIVQLAFIFRSARAQQPGAIDSRVTLQQVFQIVMCLLAIRFGKRFDAIHAPRYLGTDERGGAFARLRLHMRHVISHARTPRSATSESRDFLSYRFRHGGARTLHRGYVASEGIHVTLEAD